MTPNQFGFQENKSTEEAINAITNNIINSFEIKESAYCIILDSANTVNRTILRNKLGHYIIGGTPTKLVNSYLHDRLQYTIDDTLLNIDYIKYGVPQGRVLGPQLFSFT